MTTSNTRSHPAAAPITSVEAVARQLTAGKADRPTLLAVWAHPDDESMVGAGLMAAMAEQGAQVVNVSATLGEHGTDDPATLPPLALAGVRRGELSTALRMLGAEPAHLFDFEDGTCADIPLEEGARRVGDAIDHVRPDVVLTFGDDGVTGHPDHRAVSAWTSQAVAERDGAVALVATAAAEAWPDDLIEGLAELNAFWPGFPSQMGRAPARHARVSGPALGCKMRALRAHVTQMTPLFARLGEQGMRRLAAAEAYRPANALAAERLSEVLVAA